MRLLLADDHPLVLDGLDRLFKREPDVELISICRDGEEALAAIRREKPDVAVLDISMPRLDGLEVLKRLHDEKTSTRIVFLTASISDEAALAAISLGAKGLVLKELAPEFVVRAVRDVHAGGTWIESNVASRALTKLLVGGTTPAEEAVHALTARETEIVRLVAAGLHNKEIGYKLGITEGTVKIHLNRVFKKLAVSNRVELANFARDHKLA
jgi:DNA-binding NarL/FixJ family response regulator